MHHAAGVVVFHFAGRARAVLAAQRARHIAPARIVGTHGAVFRVEQYATRGVGHVDAVVERLLGKAPDGRINGPRGVAPHMLGKRAGAAVVGLCRQPPGGQVLAGQLGQDVGRVHHHVFHHLAHAGLDLGHEHAQHKERGDAVDEEEGEQQADAEAHWLTSRCAHALRNRRCAGQCHRGTGSAGPRVASPAGGRRAATQGGITHPGSNPCPGAC